MIDIKKKEIINKFINTKNKEDDINFSLVLEKLNDFLSSFFNKLTQENGNKIQFKTRLIGDHSLKTNYDFVDSATIMIEYFANDEEYEFSQKLNQKSDIGKLVTVSLHPKEEIVPTTNILIDRLFNYLSLNTKNVNIFKRKNGLSVKLYDFKFFIFFYLKNPGNDNLKFQIKGKNYAFNLRTMHENLELKNKETKGKFFKLVKFYKIVERELTLIEKSHLSASKVLYFYENLLYSLPESVYESKYVYDNFIKSFEHLKNIDKYDDFEDLKNAENNPLFITDEYELFAKYYVTKKDLKLVLKQCKQFIDNIDEII